MRSDQDIWKCEEAGQLVILENLSERSSKKTSSSFLTDIQHHRDPEPDHAILLRSLLGWEPQNNERRRPWLASGYYRLPLRASFALSQISRQNQEYHHTYIRRHFAPSGFWRPARN